MQRAKIDTSRTRTDASEESRFLIYRLRPLGHSVICGTGLALVAYSPEELHIEIKQ